MIERLEVPPHTFGTSVVIALAAWAVGLALMAMIGTVAEGPAAGAAGQGVAFGFWSAGAYRLLEHLRWKGMKVKEEYQPRSFGRHLRLAIAGAIVVGLVTLLLDLWLD